MARFLHSRCRSNPATARRVFMSAIDDPIAFELFSNAIFSIADEMALTIFRTAYSGVLKSGMDFSTAFADGQGRMVAHGLTQPNHLASIPTPPPPLPFPHAATLPPHASSL